MPQQPLDDQAYLQTRDRRRRIAIAVSCLVGGIIFAPVALFLAIASAGAGHGDYGLARLLFPYSMLLTLTQRNEITGPLIVLACAQFPVYGVVLGSAALRNSMTLRVVASILGVLHLIAVIGCFSGVIPNFS
jgi:hypothetical protein